MRQKSLLPEEIPGNDMAVFCFLPRSQQSDGRPSVSDFPNHVGQKNQEGREPAEPNPRPAEIANRGSQEKAQENSRAEEQHRMLVKHADSRNPAEQEPQALRASIQNAQQDCGAKHPQYRLESIHGEKIVEGQINRRQQDGSSGEDAVQPAAAHLEQQPPREEDTWAER